MPPQSAVNAWKVVLKLFQGLSPQHTLTQEADVAAAVMQQLETLRRAFVPRATWKQLIKDMQVPRHLGAACGHASSLGRPVAWEALSVFLTAMISDCGVIEGSYANTERAKAQSLVQAVLAQLQQSKVLQLLPAAMQHCAKVLQQDYKDTALAPVALISYSSSSTSSILPRQQCAIPGLLTLNTTLVSLCSSVCTLQPSQPEVSKLHTACARLALSVFHHTTKLLATPQYAAGSMPPEDVLPISTLALAFTELTNIARYLMDKPHTAITESQEVQQALSVVVFVTHCFALLLPETAQQSEPAAGTPKWRSGSSSSTSRGSRDSSSIEAAAAAAQKQWGQFDWQLGQESDAAAAGPLRDTCLDRTGVSARAAALVAACSPWEQATWVVDMAMVAARLLTVRVMADTTRLRAQHRQLPQELAFTAGSAAAMVHTPEEEPQQLCDVLSAWFEPLMPTVLQLMGSLVQRLQDSKAAAAAPAAAAGSAASSTTRSSSSRAASSSSTRVNSSSGSTTSSSNTGKAAEAPHTAVAPLVALLCLVRKYARTERLESPGQLVKRCWVWHKHDAQLAAMLDGLVRGSLQFVGCPQDLAGIAGDLSDSLADVAFRLLAEDRVGPVPVSALGRPSDTIEQHTLALCISLQKVSLVLDVVGPDESAGLCRGACALCARTVMLNDARSVLASIRSGTDSTAGAAQAATAAVAVLPWLVLFGRCCLHWASEVQQLQQARPDLGQQLVRMQRRGSISARDLCSTLQVDPMHGVVVALGADSSFGGATLAANTADVTKTWLVAPIGGGRVQVLEGLGYPAEATLQALEAVLASIADIRSAADAAAATAALGQLAGALRVLGRVLNTLAIPHACNNAGCANLAGATETEMVSGRSCICAGCRVARYCGRSCQTAAWRAHKPVCQRLAAAGAAAKLMQA